jgi:hypothetical protein
MESPSTSITRMGRILPFLCGKLDDNGINLSFQRLGNTGKRWSYHVQAHFSPASPSVTLRVS